MAEWKRSRDSYHDRWIECTVIRIDGTSIVQHFDLSGGLDYLMDPSKATKVYRYEVDAKRQKAASV